MSDIPIEDIDQDRAGDIAYRLLQKADRIEAHNDDDPVTICLALLLAYDTKAGEEGQKPVVAPIDRDTLLSDGDR